MRVAMASASRASACQPTSVRASTATTTTSAPPISAIQRTASAVTTRSMTAPLATVAQACASMATAWMSISARASTATTTTSAPPQRATPPRVVARSRTSPMGPSAPARRSSWPSTAALKPAISTGRRSSATAATEPVRRQWRRPNGLWSGNLIASVPAEGGAPSFPLIKNANIGIGIVTPDSDSHDFVRLVRFVGRRRWRGVRRVLLRARRWRHVEVCHSRGRPIFPREWINYTYTTITGPDVSGGVTLQ